jgi:transposase
MQTTKTDALYAGADLHGNNVFLSLCDKEGKNVFRKRVKTNLEAVNAALDPYWKRIVALGVESTFNWYWFVDGLREQGCNVKLGNPAKMEQYKGIKITNDLTDADWLAEQLRLGIFPESYIYPKETRPVRDALRRRQLFVQRRTQVLLSFGSLLERYGLDAPGARKIEKWTLEDIQATGLDGFVQLQLAEAKRR